MSSLRHSLEEHELSVSLDVPSDLPRVDADPGRLNQILVNLVGNAIKYTPRGGHIEISAKVRQAEDGTDEGSPGFLCCAVRDSGVGISPRDHPAVFQRFFRANHPFVRKQTGTGLGLSVSKTLVEMHGGSIWFESQLDVGSTFWFTIPLVQEKDSE